MKKGEYAKAKQQQRQSALQQIHVLFDAAALAFPSDAAKADAMVAKAHKLMQRSKVKLPVLLKKRFCKECKALWVPGATVRVRLTKGRLVYTCLKCKRIQRMPLR